MSVKNPAKIAGFGQSKGSRNKTDKIDSGLIGLYCVESQPKEWKPPTPEQKLLRAWIWHVQALKKTRTQQINRKGTVREEGIRDSLQNIIELLDKEIKEIQTKIHDLLEQHPNLKRKHELLESIKGFGAETASLILAEFYDLAEYEDAHAVAADAGLTPRRYESGTSVKKRPRISKMGKKAIRAGLYYPAISAWRHNPIIKKFADRLLRKGKDKPLIYAAIKRKLLHIAYGVLKNDTPFDPCYLG